MAVTITSVIVVDDLVEVDEEEEEAFDDGETYASEDAPVGQRGRAIFVAVAEEQYDRHQGRVGGKPAWIALSFTWGLRWDIGEATGPEWAEVAYPCAIPGLARGSHLTTRSAWSCPTRK